MTEKINEAISRTKNDIELSKRLSKKNWEAGLFIESIRLQVRAKTLEDSLIELESLIN